MSWGGRKVPRLRQQVVDYYGRTCWLCGANILGTVSVDHVIPRSKGGTDDLDNLRPCCLRCNMSRGNRMGPGRAPVTSRDW
ncbi:MAG: HNH endonuclease [Actinobacteria bacterium]|nr:HNH endonuclease [Actinomycetota bacterium]